MKTVIQTKTANHWCINIQTF